jgi:hypothetical protein
MVEAAGKAKRVVQVGTQRRSTPFLKEPADFVRAGGIGRVTMVSSSHICESVAQRHRQSAGRQSRSEWEWDHWLGPAPKVPLNENREFYKFRWFSRELFRRASTRSATTETRSAFWPAPKQIENVPGLTRACPARTTNAESCYAVGELRTDYSRCCCLMTHRAVWPAALI